MAEDNGDWVSMTPKKTAQEYSAVDSGKERDSRDRILGNLSSSDACFGNVSRDSGCNASLGLNGGISDFLEDTPKLIFNFNLEVQPGIRAIIQRYQCRKKMRSNLMYKEYLNLKEKIITPEEGSKMQYGARFSGLKVYKRILRRNECLKNSRKLGPNFPRMFKKKRMKQQRSTISHKFFCVKKMNPCIRHKVTSKEYSTYHRSVEKIIRGGLPMKLADGTHQKRIMDDELSSNFSMKEYNLRVILPSQRQMMEAMVDPKSFNCAWSLCPMANFRKKRSRTRSRNTKLWGVQEEMKHPEPQGCTFPLTWSVEYKRKRSNMPARSRDLSSLCLVPTAFPLNALRLVTQDTRQENVEDCAVPYFGAHSLIETQIFAGQHLDRKHMFSNLNADEVQGMTDFISQIFERLCMSDVNN